MHALGRTRLQYHVRHLSVCSNYKLDVVDRVKGKSRACCSVCGEVRAISLLPELDLVSRLTTAEKISQLGNTAPAIERLSIPAYQW